MLFRSNHQPRQRRGFRAQHRVNLAALNLRCRRCSMPVPLYFFNFGRSNHGHKVAIYRCPCCGRNQVWGWNYNGRSLCLAS